VEESAVVRWAWGFSKRSKSLGIKSETVSSIGMFGESDRVKFQKRRDPWFTILWSWSSFVKATGINIAKVTSGSLAIFLDFATLV
jgi:hypothetical protein